jgi:2-polyprenyl-3-methyl-5-hydroxy-6-metoxy-1,4-benzoquinol methylase
VLSLLKDERQHPCKDIAPGLGFDSGKNDSGGTRAMSKQTEQFDQEKAESFAGQLLSAINASSTVALISVGNQTGLFDAMAAMPRATSDEIARHAGLNERYVREWLGGMVVGKVLDYDPSTKRFSLPPEHAAFLITAAGPNNLSVLARLIPVLAAVEKQVLAAFKTGDGVPYSAFEDFQAVQDEINGPTVEANLVKHYLPLVDRAEERLQEGIDVLEIGTGAGRATILLAKAFPNSRFTAYDFSPDGIETARGRAAAAGLTNVTFEVKNLEAMDETSRYDLAFNLDVVHDLARPDVVLRNVSDALKPGGVFLSAEPAASSNLENNLEHPVGPFLYASSLFHCMSVAIAQGGIGVGAMVGEDVLEELIRGAGFSQVTVKHLEGDPFYAFFIAQK